MLLGDLVVEVAVLEVEVVARHLDLDLAVGAGRQAVDDLHVVRPDRVGAVRVLPPEDRDVADGEIGELWVRGESAAAGYWNQREKSRHTFVGAWTRTGDKYVRRADGVYTFCGRADDMFRVSGAWVSPFEVEAALIGHPQVVEAAVVAAEDDNGLIKPKAFVVLRNRRDGDDSRALYEELKVLVKREIGAWKYPRWIEFVDSLPKTATGKIQRFMLRDMGLDRDGGAR